MISDLNRNYSLPFSMSFSEKNLGQHYCSLKILPLSYCFGKTLRKW